MYGSYADAQVCGVAGSLERAGGPTESNSTYLLPDYTIPCDGVVYKWEYCYVAFAVNTITFYPSIWRPNNGTNSHTLINITGVTFTTMNTSGFARCINHTIADDEQFNVSTGDIVGLYSANFQLATNGNNFVISYIYRGRNQSGTVDHNNRATVHVTIAIKAYISKNIYSYCS